MEERDELNNTAADVHRAKVAKKVAGGASEWRPVDNDLPDSEELRLAVQTILDGDQRRVIQVRLDEDCTIKQALERCGLTRMTTYNAAIRKLQRHFQRLAADDHH